jgi:hypothetical protein
MQTVPEIVIYVRHSAGCKYTSDERSRRCGCRKFLRWSAGGKRHKRAANTRSWAEAEKLKRDLGDQFSGKVDERRPRPRWCRTPSNCSFSRKLSRS